MVELDVGGKAGVNFITFLKIFIYIYDTRILKY